MRPSIAACLAALLAATISHAHGDQFELARTDGSILHYSVSRPVGEAIGTIVIAQGSGCLPTRANANLALIAEAFPTHAAVMVEKKGVAPDADIVEGFGDCPESFHAGHTVSQRVADYEAVLAANDLPRPLVLFGGSEGGLAVAMLATRVDSDATILLSSASGIPFAEMVLSTVPPEGQEFVRAGLAAAAADPEGLTIFAGSSHRFWADIMGHLELDYMLKADSPFLVVQGGLDTSSPVAAARVTADRFAAEGRCNLTYWEYPALDHGMADPEGVSHLEAVAAAVAGWARAPVDC